MTLKALFSPECRVFPVPFPLFHNLSLFTHSLGSRTEAASDSWLWPLLVTTMIKTPSDHLLYSLEGLVPNDFERFKFKLQNTSLEKDHSRIPRGQLQTARPVKLASLLITHYGEEYAVRLTLQVLRAINQNFLAEELHKATGPGKQAPGPCLPAARLLAVRGVRVEVQEGTWV